MAYIRHIPPALAEGRLAEVYRQIRADVPRVPNLMQVFSLRPDTLEGVHRSWLSIMWTGQVPRQTKELMAVAVSRSARCDYCTDAHMVFLQAAGMPHDKAHEIEHRLELAEALSPQEREAVRFAIRVTLEPRALATGDRLLLAKAWPNIDKRVELITTMAAIVTVSTMANALGVASEIPTGLRRFETGRRGVIALLSRLTAVSVDLAERSIHAHTPEENHTLLSDLFEKQLGFGSLPPGFDLLENCPEIFDGQLNTIRKSVAVVPRDRWMRIGLTVGRLTGCDYLSANCGYWLAQRSERPADVIAASEGSPSRLPDAEIASLRFARDVTLHSHTIDEARIRELRSCGLSDGAVLDLTFVAAVLNGVSRLIVSLSPA